MNGKSLRTALHEGTRVYGSLLTAPSPHWANAVKGTGLDFVFIDTEHIPLERTALAWMCRTYAALDLAPIVRIPSPDPYAACVALDGGAEGVIAPYVESAEEARRLVGAVRYRPLKGERLRRLTHGGAVLEEPLRGYIEERCAGNVLILNIESVPAIEKLDEILAVPGIDAVQVGPHDLTCSLGVPEDYAHPRFLAAVSTIIRTARARGVGVGTHFWANPDQHIAWMREGANLVVQAADINYFCEGIRKDVRRFRRAFGETPVDSEEVAAV